VWTGRSRAVSLAQRIFMYVKRIDERGARKRMQARSDSILSIASIVATPNPGPGRRAARQNTTSMIHIYTTTIQLGGVAMRAGSWMALFLFLNCSAAIAETTVSTRSEQCRNSYGGGSVCTTVIKTDDGADARPPSKKRDQEQERQDAEAARFREAKWQEFCKPYPRVDRFNVTRFQYAHSGCDLGRTGENEQLLSQ
jgi:hypothetical protein